MARRSNQRVPRPSRGFGAKHPDGALCHAPFWVGLLTVVLQESQARVLVLTDKYQ